MRLSHEANFRIGLGGVCLIVGLLIGGLLTAIRARNEIAIREYKIRGLNRLLEDTKHREEVWQKLATGDYKK